MSFREVAVWFFPDPDDDEACVRVLDFFTGFSYIGPDGEQTISSARLIADTNSSQEQARFPADHALQELMKAIILCAGQGRRLLPFTEEEPKCLLAVDGNRSVLELQLRALAWCGITQVTIMVGFGADRVERFLATHPIPGLTVRTRYNPFFDTTNNLVTCWSATGEMTEDFILLNGDTLFDPDVPRLLLASPEAPVTLVINRKAEYDDDDMKVSLNGGRKLKAVGKTLPLATVHGESIGLMMFRGLGVSAFRDALDVAIREPQALQMWYLSVINSLCPSSFVETVALEGRWWAEIDTCEDLAKVRAYFTRRQSPLVRVPQTWERDRPA